MQTRFLKSLRFYWRDWINVDLDDWRFNRTQRAHLIILRPSQSEMKVKHPRTIHCFILHHQSKVSGDHSRSKQWYKSYQNHTLECNTRTLGNIYHSFFHLTTPFFRLAPFSTMLTLIIWSIHSIIFHSIASGSQTHCLNLLASHEHLKYLGQSFVCPWSTFELKDHFWLQLPHQTPMWKWTSLFIARGNLAPQSHFPWLMRPLLLQSPCLPHLLWYRSKLWMFSMVLWLFSYSKGTCIPILEPFEYYQRHQSSHIVTHFSPIQRNYVFLELIQTSSGIALSVFVA